MTDAISMQLCKDAGLNEMQAQALVQRVTAAVHASQNRTCPHEECCQPEECLRASVCVDSWGYVHRVPQPLTSDLVGVIEHLQQTAKAIDTALIEARKAYAAIVEKNEEQRN